MKITKISCEQFAGTRDRDISLTDGINLIYGKNESGKSTLVNILSRTLFQNSKIDGRKDKDFMNAYFPSTRKGSSITADSADGKVTFETGSGKYTLSKTWGADPRCSLSTTDGLLRDQAKIDEILKKELIYGEGVYKDMLLSPQDNTQAALQTIIDASKDSDAKREIADAVSQAFSESGGISMDAIEQAIDERIDVIEGKHWDFENEMPARKAGRWASGLGEILKAYYELKDTQKVLDDISDLEEKVSAAEEKFTTEDKSMNKAEEAYNQFNMFSTRLALQAKSREVKGQISEQIKKLERVSKEWPKFNEELTKAQELQDELNNCRLKEQYNDAKEIKEKINSLTSELAKQDCPSDKEIAQVRGAEKQISKLENSLCSMNITAAVDMIGNNQIEITSLLTGEPIELSDGLASITEAVKISILGIMEMTLAPADVNITAIEAEIATQRGIKDSIFDKYEVKSVEELSELANEIHNKETELRQKSERLMVVLNGADYDELEKKASEIPSELREMEEINDDIVELCQDDNVSIFITAKKTTIETYENEYKSISMLEENISDLKEKLQKEKDSLPNVDDIPEEYLTIASPESYLKGLKLDLDNIRHEREEALTDKTTAVVNLENYLEKLSDDPQADRDESERKFNEKKELLAHWKHIKEVFQKMKNEIHDNPMQDIADSFTSYLSVISGGRVSSEFPDADKLNMNIYSDNNLIDYAKLSEGTKETVSLAFRLAVLDHLFPEGGGVIVFDDPFTDMDAERTAQSCQLIKECAKKHQVIFLTCKDEYFDSLGGNQINLSAE